MWSGSQTSVACIPLTQGGNCCDSNITQVITDVAQFACDTNVSDLTKYDYTCLADSCACSITSFFDLFNLVITKVCNLEAGVVGDLDWNCYTTPESAITGITQVIQYLIDQTCLSGKPSGLNPYCYTLPETYDINTVLEAIMQQTCDMLQLSGLTWGSCFSAPISNSLQDVIQNILTTVCSITNLDLNWGCFVNHSLSNSINDSFQNTIDEINYRFDFQNINWSCIHGSTTCDATISLAFNTLIEYMCNQLDMSTINWSCFTGTTTNSIVAVINQLITELCNISLSWGCLTPTLGLKNQLQTIINAINAQTIAYNTNHFVVTGTTCADRGLSLKQGEWVAFLPYKYGASATTPITKYTDLNSGTTYTTVEVSNGFSLVTSSINPQGSYSQPQMYAYLDALGNVTIVGTFTVGLKLTDAAYRKSYGITSAYLTTGSPGSFENENGTGTISMTTSGTYMPLFSMPTINGVNYFPGVKGMSGVSSSSRGEVTCAGYGINWDVQYYYGSGSTTTTNTATYSTSINYPKSSFPALYTIGKDTNGRPTVTIQPGWDSQSKVPITLYFKATFNINN
jgi:hypothetical protein